MNKETLAPICKMLRNELGTWTHEIKTEDIESLAERIATFYEEYNHRSPIPAQSQKEFRKHLINEESDDQV